MFILNKGHFTHKNIAHLVQATLEEIEQGRLDPLELYIELDANAKLIKETMSAIKETAMNEARKYSKGENNLFGVEFTVNNGRKNPLYKNDPEYLRLSDQLKDRQELLKTALGAKGSAMFDEESGEEIPKVPVEYSADSLSIKLPKE